MEPMKQSDMSPRRRRDPPKSGAPELDICTPYPSVNTGSSTALERSIRRSNEKIDCAVFVSWESLGCPNMHFPGKKRRGHLKGLLYAVLPMTTLDADDFRNCVKKYVDLHDELTTASKHLSELRKQKDAIGQLIVDFMKHKQIDECELQNGGKLVRRESRRTEALKKEHILQELVALTGNETNAERCLETIYSKRGVEVKDTLTRTKR